MRSARPYTHTGPGLLVLQSLAGSLVYTLNDAPLYPGDLVWLLLPSGDWQQGAFFWTGSLFETPVLMCHNEDTDDLYDLPLGPTAWLDWFGERL